jgi:hypothetical protein
MMDHTPTSYSNCSFDDVTSQMDMLVLVLLVLVLVLVVLLRALQIVYISPPPYLPPSTIYHSYKCPERVCREMALIPSGN